MAGSVSQGPANHARTSANPTRFRCKVGGEWLPLDAFSKKQQRMVQPRLDRGGTLDPANTGMVCSKHSGAPRTELRCVLCDLIKPASEFSANSRKSDENICKRCCAWSETQEPEVTPTPLATGHISVEEKGKEVWQKSYVESNDFFPDAMPQAPITELSSLGLEGQEVLSRLKAEASMESGRASSVASTASSLPPHLRALEAQLGSSLGKDASDASVASAGSSGPGSRIAPASVSTATTMREAAVRGLGSVAYNAWGPDGKHHKVVKSPTVPSSSGQGSVTSSDRGSDSGGPSYRRGSAAQGTPKKHRGSKWFKAPRLSRAELQAVPAQPHVSAQHHDEMDRQLRMNYCQSEDSNF